MLRDNRLSYKARGILAMLLSNKETWEVNKGYLQEMGTEGREAIQGAITELEARGYMRCVPQSRAGGRFVDNVWNVYDTPCPANERTFQTKWNQQENFKKLSSHHVREAVHGEPQTENRIRETVHGFPPPKNTSTQNTTEEQQKGDSSPPAPGDDDKEAKSEHSPPKPLLPKADVIAAWNELVPSLPGIVSINGKREKEFRARWGEDPNLENWKGHFRYIESSDFLAGRLKTQAHKFEANFDWLIKPSNFQKIRERKYRQEQKNVTDSKPTEEPKGFFAGANLKPKPKPHDEEQTV